MVRSEAMLIKDLRELSLDQLGILAHGKAETDQKQISTKLREKDLRIRGSSAELYSSRAAAIKSLFR